MGSTDAERIDRDGMQSLLGHGSAQPLRRIAADRQQRSDRLVLEARERVAERGERCCVQPLEVVDREADTTLAGQESQRAEERGGDRAVVGADVRLSEKQCSLERPPLNGWQLRQDSVDDVSEKVGETPVREAGLRLRGSRGENAEAALDRCVSAGQPERRLPDPGLARQDDGARKLLRTVEEPDESFELFVPADEISVRLGARSSDCAPSAALAPGRRVTVRASARTGARRSRCRSAAAARSSARGRSASPPTARSSRAGGRARRAP